MTDGLATKADLREAVAKMEAAIAKAQTAQSRHTVGAMVGLTMIFIAAVKYF